MTDCSCEGFCNTVKAGQLAVVGWGFFLSLFLPGSSRQTGGRTGSSGTCHILSHFGLQLYMTEAASLLPGSPTKAEGTEKKKSFQAPGRTEERVRRREGKKKHFPLVLTCISKPLLGCSRKQIGSTRAHGGGGVAAGHRPRGPAAFGHVEMS